MHLFTFFYNKTAKSVLDLPIDASSSQALTMLKWYLCRIEDKFTDVVLFIKP